MPLKLDIKRKLSARSDRVKSVDIHPSEPWMLVSLYNGHVHIWNHESQQLVKSFEVCEPPVRAAKFVARKNWVVTGSDDMHVRVFNYNTLERLHQFEAHSDYIRCLAVHPVHAYLLSSSDDMTIKLWDWENKWACKQVESNSGSLNCCCQLFLSIYNLFMIRNYYLLERLLFVTKKIISCYNKLLFD